MQGTCKPSAQATLSARTLFSGIMLKLTPPLDAKTQHNCQMLNIKFTYIKIV